MESNHLLVDNGSPKAAPLAQEPWNPITCLLANVAHRSPDSPRAMKAKELLIGEDSPMVAPEASEQSTF